MPNLLRRALTLLSILYALSPSGLEAAPTKVALSEQLASVGQRLKRAADDLEAHLATQDARALKTLSQAQVAFFEEDYGRAAALLLDLTARPGFKRSNAYSEAHGELGVSLWRMGMRRLAAGHLRRALEAPAPLLAPYRRLLIRYLRLTAWAEPIARARRFWDVYVDLRTSRVNLPEDDEAHYQYARALYAQGALAEAERRFVAVEEGSPFYLQALYFQAVIHLHRDELLDARDRLDDAEAAYLLKTQLMNPERPYLEEIDVDGDAREILKLELSEAEILPSEATLKRRRIGVAIHLAQARLAAAMEDNPRAWRYYRKIPRGSPEFAAALSEATSILFQRGEYAWCVRLLDQLIAGRGDDLSTAQLLLWKGQLLAQEGAYEDAHDHYERLKGHFKIQAERLLEEADGTRALFSPTLLAWSAPTDANRLRGLEAELIEQEESLIEAREILELLREIATEPSLPVVADRRDFIDDLGDDLRALSADLDRAEAEELDGEAGDDAPSRADIKAMRRSVKRAWGRLERYEARLKDFDGRFSKALAQIIREETPRLKAFDAALASALRRARALAREMRAQAEENVALYAAEALFGQVDLAWWRKEEVSRELTGLFVERQRIQKSELKAIEVED